MEKQLLADWIERLDARLDKIEDTLSDIRVIQERNTGSLEEHMRRSDAIEKAVDVLRAEMKPIETHVAVVGGVAKVAGGLATLAGAALAISQLLGRVV